MARTFWYGPEITEKNLHYLKFFGVAHSNAIKPELNAVNIAGCCKTNIKSFVK